MLACFGEVWDRYVRDNRVTVHLKPFESCWSCLIVLQSRQDETVQDIGRALKSQCVIANSGAHQIEAFPARFEGDEMVLLHVHAGIGLVSERRLVWPGHLKREAVPSHPPSQTSVHRQIPERWFTGNADRDGKITLVFRLDGSHSVEKMRRLNFQGREI